MQLLLEAHGIVKFFAAHKIFSFDTFSIYSGDKIGIVGQNGCGKTTLLNILSGDIEPDEGYVKSHCTVSYLKQFGKAEPSDDLLLLSKYGVKDKAYSEGLSGGEKTRLKIVSSIGNNSSLLFADEPTSNLDFSGIKLVEQALLDAKSVLLVSHDRRLLDTVCNKIVAIEGGKLCFYNGNYSMYLEHRSKQKDRAQFEYNQYIEEKSRLEASVVQIKNKANSITKAPKRMGNSEARLHKGGIRDRQKYAHQKSHAMEGRLSLLEEKEKPAKDVKVALDFSLTNPPQNKILIEGKNLSFSYSKGMDLFVNSSFTIPNGSKTCLWGPNGCGKTTLLNIISSESLQAIRKAPTSTIGYFYQNFDNIDFGSTVLQNAMAESIQSESTTRTILARLLFKRDDISKLASSLSGGELIKLSLAKLFTSPANVLLLDEPTNYLDIPSSEELQKMLCDYPGTVIFVSHDRDLVNNVSDRLIVFKDKSLLTFEGSLDDYELKSDKSASPSDLALEISILEMRLLEISAKLSGKKELKADVIAILESEYAQTLSKIQECKR